MSVRRLFLDRSPGEARGVVTLDGSPERLWIEREGVAGGPRLGERHRARVEELSPSLRLARLVLEGGQEAALQLPKVKTVNNLRRPCQMVRLLPLLAARPTALTATSFLRIPQCQSFARVLRSSSC